MQLTKIEVRGLFGLYDHIISFPQSNDGHFYSNKQDNTSEPSILIMYGQNGVGKTTVLRMLQDIMKLDFKLFRTLPFDYFSVSFNKQTEIIARPKKHKDKFLGIEVSYDNHKVTLHPEKPGPLSKEDSIKVEIFRKIFFDATESLDFLFIDTRRFINQFENAKTSKNIINTSNVIIESNDEHLYKNALNNYILSKEILNPKAKKEQNSLMADRVIRFINEAQANYRRFFSNKEPDLFERVLENLSEISHENYNYQDLNNRLKNIITRDEEAKRLGLEPDIREPKRLFDLISMNQSKQDAGYFLNTLGAYIGILESRSNERNLLAKRLL